MAQKAKVGELIKMFKKTKAAIMSQKAKMAKKRQKCQSR